MAKERRYRLSEPGEIGQLKPKKWFQILQACHTLSLVPTIIIFLNTENPAILVLHFPVMFLIFILMVSYGSDHVVYFD